MEVSAPHRPAHKSDEFWYYPKEALLLYENKGQPRPNYLESAHSDRGKWEHRQTQQGQGEHTAPHGIKFRDGLLTPSQRDRNAANAELVIRMCCELGLTPMDEESRRHQLLPVPKFLALFLEAKRTYMYKAESLTQALILMQTQALNNKKNVAN